jgi:hypothetical protein
MTTPAVGRREMAQAYAALLGATVLAALVAAVVPGVARFLRGWFAFDTGARPSTGGVARIALANLRILGFLLLASLATTHRRLVPLLDAVVTLGLVANVGLVGLALGVYGSSLLPWLPHVPFEWAALAIGLAAYLRARRLAPRVRDVARAGALAVVPLVLAAVIEAWATPLALP